MRRRTQVPFLIAVVATLSNIGSLPLAAQATAPRVLSFLEAIKGTDEVELRRPVAVAAASSEEIAVADAFGPRLMRFRRVGVSWALAETADLPAVPVGLTWDGVSYVASLREGQGLVAFNGPNLVQRQLQLPPGVVPGAVSVFPNSDLLLYDYAGSRAVRVADGELKEVAQIEGAVTALATGPSGDFFAAVPVGGKLLHFDAMGKLSGTWQLPPSNGIPAWPVGLAVEPAGDVIVVDRHLGRLLVLDAGGKVIGLGSRQGWEPGLLLYPAGIARLPNGLLLVADQGNGRAQVFRRAD